MAPMQMLRWSLFFSSADATMCQNFTQKPAPMPSVGLLR